MSNLRQTAHLVVAAGVVAAILSTGATGAPQTDQLQVDRIFEPWTAAGSPGCAVSVMRDGTIAFSSGYGRANLEYDIPLTPTSVFHVASIAKQFTALAVQLLVNERRLSWDDDIRQYVPEMSEADRPITLRQLAQHTSGIRDQWSLLRMAGWRFEADVVKTEDVLDLLSRQTRTHFEPGSEFLYSNSGYTLLAVVVERVTGQPLRRFAAERIFEPLGMHSTHFHDDHQMVVRNRAYAYAASGSGGFRSAVPDFDIVGATSLFTTVEDLAHWDRNFYTFDVGGEGGIRQLHEPGVLTDGRSTTYAFGLAHGRYREFATVGHGGSDSGYRSEFIRFPDQRLSVSVLCNLSSANPTELARRVADVFLPGEERRTSLPAASPTGTTAGATTRQTTATPEAGPALSNLAGYYRRRVSDVPLHLVERQGVLVSIGTGPALQFSRREGAHFQVTGSMSTSAVFEGSNGNPPTTLRFGDSEGDYDEYERSDPWRPTPTELETFVGAYRSAELDIEYTFTVRGRTLVLHNRKLGAITLVPTYPDGFYGDGLYLGFERNAAGAVDAFTISTPRAWKVAFSRVHDTR